MDSAINLLTGAADIQLNASAVVDQIEVSPRWGHWAMRAAFQGGTTADVHCPPLGATAPYAWWFHDLGIDPKDRNRGADVRVGLIDVRLPEAPEYKFMKTVHRTNHPSSEEAERHGGHIAALMGGRLPDFAFEGVAPAAQYVFAQAGSNKSTDEVSSIGAQLAIEILARREECDIIVVSVGDCRERMPHLERAIEDAEKLGALCVFAGGNDPSQQKFPASYPAAISIGAYGAEGHPITGSVEALRRDTESACRSNGRYMLNGLKGAHTLKAVAPGVAIEVGLPNEIHHVTGSSYSAPIAAGLLACLCAKDSRYMHAKRHHRPRIGRKIIERHLHQSGLTAITGKLLDRLHYSRSGRN
ncbi:MAG: S8/S53 family peptidase [Terricaulis sp.]